MLLECFDDGDNISNSNFPVKTYKIFSKYLLESFLKSCSKKSCFNSYILCYSKSYKLKTKFSCNHEKNLFD